MAGLPSPTDIANRAIQYVGGTILAAGTLSTATSKNATQINACFDMVRRAEMRRNAWRFCARRTVLRAYQAPSNIVGAAGPSGVTMRVTFGTWVASMTTYAQNDIVTGSDGLVYISKAASNTGNDPTKDTSYAWWTLYFGPDAASEFVTTWVSTITYSIGNNVIGSDGNPYLSKANTNLNHDPTTDGGVHWSAGIATRTATVFFAGELVYAGNKLYLSLVENNTVDPTTNVDSVTGNTYTNSWLQMTTAATLVPLTFISPLGSGPYGQSAARNIFRLPVGYLRPMPQIPKGGLASVMGAPTNPPISDWEYDGKYLLSSTPGPIIFRFAADVSDTTEFDPMFAEGLACRIGVAICEPVTQSGPKLANIASAYKEFMGWARQVNAIEQGPEAAPLDDFLAVRY